VQALVGYGGRRKPIGGDDQAMAKLTDYVMTAEAAEILGVAQNTIRKWAAQGKIPMHRNPANGYRLFKRSDLEKFLRQVESSGTSKPKRKK
jgi:excisionase family DNA binding protein